MTDPILQRKLNLMYGFIQDYTARRGYSPALREIACGCGLSLNAVFRYLGQLEAQGRVTRVPGQTRSVRVIPATSNIPRADTAPAQPGQPPTGCAGRSCPLLSGRWGLLCEFISEKGVASSP